MGHGKRLRVLIIEDTIDDAELLLRELHRNGYDIVSQRVETAEELLRELHQHPWDVVISDYSLPGFNAPAALRLIQEHSIDIPFIIVSGTVGEDTAVSAMKAGAHDFFAKNKLQLLAPAIERELREAEERRRRHHVEDQLRQSEERFAKIFHASPVGISITAADGRFLDVNEYFLRLVGYKRDEIIGRTADEIGLWNNISTPTRVRQLLEQLGTVRNIETQCCTKDGQLRDVLASFEQVELGGAPCELTLLHDITDRKQAQDELRALYNATSYLFNANSLFSLGQQIVQAVVQEFGQVDCGLLLVDHARNQMFRLARAGGQVRTEASLYLDSKGLIPEAVRNQSIIYVPDVSLDHRYVANNEDTRSEFVIPLRTSKGVLGVLDLQSTQLDAFPERERRIVIAFGERAAAAIESMQLYEEINRHAAELEWRVGQRTAELQRSKERLESILNNSSDPIVLIDADGVIEQANDSFTTLFGIPHQDTTGGSLLSLVEPEYRPALTSALKSAVTMRRVARLDLLARASNNIVFDAEVSFAPVMENTPHPANLICGIRDITERKRGEQELIRALKKEREVNELKSRFVSMVSHEFRTPLSTILSSSEVLKAYKDRMSQEKQFQHLDRIYSQVHRMISLLNDVLTLSKAEAVGMNFAPVPTELERFSRDIVEDMQFIAPNHPIAFNYIGDRSEVTIDPELLRQVLSNLMSNAIKYSPEGKAILFRVERDDTQVKFSVQDSGIGIPEEDQPRLFEAFHRARNSGTIQGTGLGLAIVKRAVDAHHGSITFESRLGVGTTFIVTIPLTPPVASAE